MPDFTPHATAPTVLDPKVFFRRFSLLAGAGALLLVALLGLLAVVAITHKKAEVVAQVEQRQQLLAGAYAASVQAWLGRATQVADDFAAAEATRAFASGLTSSGVAVKNFRQLFDQTSLRFSLRCSNLSSRCISTKN